MNHPIHIDAKLVADVQKLATGQHIHFLANCLTIYQLACGIGRREQVRTCEQNLRKFVQTGKFLACPKCKKIKRTKSDQSKPWGYEHHNGDARTSE